MPLIYSLKFIIIFIFYKCLIKLKAQKPGGDYSLHALKLEIFGYNNKAGMRPPVNVYIADFFFFKERKGNGSKIMSICLSET